MKFTQSKLKDWTKDRDEWLDELEKTRADLETMSSKISEEDFKIHILNNLPKEYESLIKKLIPDIDILKSEDLREELQSKYNCIMKYNDKNENNEEQALATSQPF